MAKHAALFDLDGVIIDSEGLYTEFWADMDKRFPTGVADFAMKIKGSTLPRIYDAYFPDKRVQNEISAMLEDFEHKMQAEIYPGVCDMISDLRSAGFSIAIVTSSNRQKMTRLLQRLPVIEQIVDTILTDADVTNSKPHPEGYMKAAERLGCRPCDCVVFEDSFAGIEAGRRAGGKVVGVATTNLLEDISPLVDIAVRNTADVTSDDLLRLFV